MMTCADSELPVLAKGWSISTIDRTTLRGIFIVGYGCVCALLWVMTGLAIYGSTYTTHVHAGKGQHMHTHTHKHPYVNPYITYRPVGRTLSRGK